MAELDPRDVDTVAKAIREAAWEESESEPMNAHDDAVRLAEIALMAAQELPRRAQIVRANRNG